MEWTHDMSVGVEQIDERNSQLIIDLDAFLTSLRRVESRLFRLQAVWNMECKVVAHFRAEEAMHLESRYPGYGEHKKLHQALIRFAIKTSDDIRRKDLTSTEISLVAATLSTWLSLHIKKADMDFGTFLRGGKSGQAFR